MGLSPVSGSTVELVSVDLASSAGSGTAEWSEALPRGARAISDDGRYVVFQSTAGNLVAGVAAGPQQVYLRDRKTGSTSLVSHSTAGPTTAGNGASRQAAISGDGRFVAFVSDATDLTAPDNPATTREVYRYTVADGTVINVSYSASATGGLNGRFPRISFDGTVIAFASDSPDLIAGQTDTNGGSDLFVWSGVLTLASRALGTSTTTGNAALDPTEGFDLSADGRCLTFLDGATNLVAGGDTNGVADLFQFDRIAGSLLRVSEASGGGASNGSVDPAFASSSDGSWVAFSSSASDLAAGVSDANGDFDVYIWERARRAISLVSHVAGNATTAAGANSVRPTLSDDGRYVLLRSDRTDLVGGTDANGAPDLFLFDRTAGTITLVSHQAGVANRTAAAPLGQGSSEAILSRDGAWAVFTSDGTDLVGSMSDTNAAPDVFLRDRAFNASSLVSHALASPTATGAKSSDQPQLTPSGGAVVFRSVAGDLTVESDENSAADVFGAFDLPALFSDSFETGSALAWSSLN